MNARYIIICMQGEQETPKHWLTSRREHPHPPSPPVLLLVWEVLPFPNKTYHKRYLSLTLNPGTLQTVIPRGVSTALRVSTSFPF